MELRKLILKCWELIKSDVIDGDEFPCLDKCEQEFAVLIESFAEIQIKKETY